MEWYVPLSCLRPRWHYTTLLDTAVKVTTRGFWAKKAVGPALQYVTRALFWLVAQNFLFNWRDSIRDPISDPIRNPIWSDPGFVDAVKTHFLRRS